MRLLERANLAREPQLYNSQAASGRYRDLDLGCPGVVIVHRAGAKGLGFDTVVVADARNPTPPPIRRRRPFAWPTTS
ncbi:hypothetical protein ACFV4P_14215 [Kitasatospora sp. NPDC059795]|uniref:hypothetical protein n=1 Tax=Kitasatospora sp. NPDC059795 TaxID=3346949 RepID=UPI003661719A